MTDRLSLDRCSINTATLGHRSYISDVIDKIEKAGFGAIAPWRRDVEGNDVAVVARQIRDAGLGVSGYCRSTYFPAATAEGLRHNVEDNRRALDDAATLGSPCFVLVVGSLPEGSKNLAGARGQVEDGLGQLLEHARKIGVPLAVEPLHPMYAGDRSCVTRLDEALDICSRVDPDQAGGIGVAIDVYHVWWDIAVLEQIRRAGAEKRIHAFHVCDWLVPTKDLLLDRGMMGDGVADIRRLRSAAEAAGFNGFIETEIFSTYWWGVPEEDVLRTCAERMTKSC